MLCAANLLVSAPTLPPASLRAPTPPLDKRSPPTVFTEPRSPRVPAAPASPAAGASAGDASGLSGAVSSPGLGEDGDRGREENDSGLGECLK